MLPDNERINPERRSLVVRHSVCGVQVHDALLAAAMHVHGISHILTLNPPGFERYTANLALIPPHRVATTKLLFEGCYGCLEIGGGRLVLV